MDWLIGVIVQAGQPGQCCKHKIPAGKGENRRRIIETNNSTAVKINTMIGEKQRLGIYPMPLWKYADDNFEVPVLWSIFNVD